MRKSEKPCVHHLSLLILIDSVELERQNSLNYLIYALYPICDILNIQEVHLCQYRGNTQLNRPVLLRPCRDHLGFAPYSKLQHDYDDDYETISIIIII